jgi:uncharacterized membrane protein YraQ (UPF0718 family)
MEFFSHFIHQFFHYLKDIWLALLFGFLASGFFYQFVPTDKIYKYLGEKGIKSILTASLIGAALPVCCIGTLPLALTLQRKKASLGAVMAFMVATPATSLPALFVCWKLLGPGFTVIVFCGAMIMSILTGIICDGIAVEPQKELFQEKSCCSHEEKPQDIGRTLSEKIKNALMYALWTLPRSIGWEIIIGIAFSSFIISFTPIQEFIHAHLTGLFGYVVIIILALVSYVCSTGDVPIAHAFIQAGLSKGQGLCYLLIGPITSYSTILVVNKKFGRRVLVVYLLTITLSSFLFGMLSDLYLSKII